MPKLTPKLPLLPDKTQPGFQLIDEIRDLVKQNMKMILLTNPGERVMMPNFGVGITGILFENFSDSDRMSFYKGRIKDQVSTHMPYVQLQEVDFFENEIDMNKISIRVKYFIPALGEEAVLKI